MTCEAWPERDEKLLEAAESGERHPLIEWSHKYGIVWPGCPNKCWAAIHACIVYLWEHGTISLEDMERSSRYLIERKCDCWQNYDSRARPNGFTVVINGESVISPMNLKL